MQNMAGIPRKTSTGNLCVSVRCGVVPKARPSSSMANHLVSLLVVSHPIGRETAGGIISCQLCRWVPFDDVAAAIVGRFLVRGGSTAAVCVVLRASSRSMISGQEFQRDVEAVSGENYGGEARPIVCRRSCSPTTCRVRPPPTTTMPPLTWSRRTHNSPRESHRPRAGLNSAAISRTATRRLPVEHLSDTRQVLIGYVFLLG